jgi:hypothetical protein
MLRSASLKRLVKLAAQITNVNSTICPSSEFSQLFERTAANRSRAARDALGVQNRGFLLLVKQRAAVVELQRLDFLACNSDSLRRSGACAGSILAAVE